MTARDEVLLLGAVAYDPKVVDIWEGFRGWFLRQGLPFDYVLYSNYERLVESLLDEHVHVAWNSPLAWGRARRLARSRGADITALAMRDTDRDLTSVIVVRADSDIVSLADLRGRRVAVGAVDSPQATLIPLSHLDAAGLSPHKDFEVQYHQIAVGKHGDHIGGEREAAQAMMAGRADAACMIDSNHLLFSVEGMLSSGSTRILCQTIPYDHCNFTATAAAPAELVGRFRDMLLGMSYQDPEVRALFDLEGLKVWREARTTGYAALEEAIDRFSFYDREGNVAAPGYRP